MQHLSHGELIEYRQRIAKTNQLQDEFNDGQIRLRKWLYGKARQYHIEGANWHIDIDTGEIVIMPEKVHYELKHSMNAVAALDFDKEDHEQPGEGDRGQVCDCPGDQTAPPEDSGARVKT